MIAKGLVPEETKHNGHRRALFHDYNRPGVYMITLVTEGRARVFGTIEGNTRSRKDSEDYPHLRCSELGSIILREEPITEYWKPPQGRFYACAKGSLLILAPWKMEGDSDYELFHSLNDLAHDICMATDTRLLGV